MASLSRPRPSSSGVTGMDGDDDEENEYDDTGYIPGNQSSGSDCYSVCQNCKRRNPNSFPLDCCCQVCHRTGGRECDDECDEELLLERCKRLPKIKGFILLKSRFPGQIYRFRLCKTVRFRQDLEFSFRTWVRTWQQSPRKCQLETRHIMLLMVWGRQVLGQDLEFVHRPDIVWNRADNQYRRQIHFRSWRLTVWKRSWKRRKFQQKLALKFLKVVFRSWRLSCWRPVD